MNKNNQPQVRFNEFSDEWNVKKLSQIADIIGGGTPSTSISEYWNGNIDWYSPTEIGKKVYATSSVKKITGLGLENSSAKILPANKTILFTSRAGIGDMAILMKEGATNQGFQSLVLKKGFHTYFIYSAKELIKKHALTRASGSTFLEISSKVLGNMDLFVPTFAEQQKIGNFFENLDKLITEHQQKHIKLKVLKRAMLDKMFPKQGQSVPDIRFKGFEEKWIHTELKEIFSFQYGIFNNNPSNGGEYPVYGANGIIGGFTKYNANNSVVIGHMGEYAGIVLWEEGKHFVTYNGIITKPKNEALLPKFGYFMLYKMDLRKICDGSGQPFLSYSTLNSIKGGYPNSHKEQEQISKYFENLDGLMKRHELQINKLSNIKSALIAKIFL